MWKTSYRRNAALKPTLPSPACTLGRNLTDLIERALMILLKKAESNFWFTNNLASST